MTDIIAALDNWLLLALRVPGDPAASIGPAWLRHAMLDVTSLGGGPVLTLFVLIAAGLLITRRAWANAVVLCVAAASGGMVVDWLKVQFGRPRPELVDHLVAVHSASFPSAHAANSALVYLSIAAMLGRIEARRIERAYTIAAALLLTLLIGFSRVYLGVHWPSDVLGGWLFGAAWALLWWAVARRLSAVTQP